MIKVEATKDYKFLSKMERDITAELKKRLEQVLADYSIIKGEAVTVQSLHGVISLNKSQNLDLVHGKWLTYDDYIAAWLMGLKDSILSRESPSMIQQIFKIRTIREYILLFLERDFYKHYKIRIKDKPQENLWSIWFGAENLFWGMLIVPRFIDGAWENKPSHVRKVNFDYWTIGHIIHTGFIDPENNTVVNFKDLNDLLTFYQSILKRVSNSLYEKQIYDFYIEYLKNSDDPFSEPFLIPEFRYDGLKQQHKYRLDFTILNCFTGERIGFELSPQSTHMAVAGIRAKTQLEMNKDLALKWKREMQKRNEYFQQFGITIITFTDDDLKDMHNCFKAMQYYLTKRKSERKSVENLIEEIITLP
jgi:hypothetical protein